MNNTVKTIFTEDALINFKRFTLTKRSILKPALMYVFCIAVIICSFIYNGRFQLNFTTILYPSLAIVCGIIISVLYYVNPKKDNQRLIGKEVTYTFAEEGIITDQVTIPYTDLDKVYEDKDYFYFYTNENDGFYIEKETLNFDLAPLLRERVSGKKTLKLLRTKG